jgi:hypothetical protein
MTSLGSRFSSLARCFAEYAGHATGFLRRQTHVQEPFGHILFAVFGLAT